MPENNQIDLSGDGGALKEILKEGTGDELPKSGFTVSLHYTGKLTDGTVFDSSVGRNPFQFELGQGRVIKAFDLCVASMKRGEKCQVTCAPDYAYGAAGSPPSIPPDATLIFELEMLDWRGQDISPDADKSIERIILENGTKKRTPVDGALIKVHLTGIYEGNTFEDRDVTFAFGEGSAYGVVPGVEIGLSKMILGEVSKFKIAPKHAFGKQGNEALKIPPNATVEYVVKLNEVEKTKEEWKLDDTERLQQGNLYKEKGTRYYQAENYALALSMYEKSLLMLLPVEKLKLDAEAVDKLVIANNLNIALCNQKMDNQFEAMTACDKVLELDDKNVKAWYRRGQCNLAINDFKKALNDFQTVLKLEPTNKAAMNQIQIAKQKLKASIEKEKKTYANMFTKFAAAEDKQQPPPTDEQDVLSECGEWSEEAARREADLAFERDNNIVMI